jgi:hypothetical protein
MNDGSAEAIELNKLRPRRRLRKFRRSSVRHFQRRRQWACTRRGHRPEVGSEKVGRHGNGTPALYLTIFDMGEDEMDEMDERLVLRLAASKAEVYICVGEGPVPVIICVIILFD